jgi:chaperonin cofactor prefoldin
MLNLEPDCCPQPAMSIQPASIVDTMKLRKTVLESQLKEVNEALEALESNPEVTKILHLVSKVSRNY